MVSVPPRMPNELIVFDPAFAAYRVPRTTTVQHAACCPVGPMDDTSRTPPSGRTRYAVAKPVASTTSNRPARSKDNANGTVPDLVTTGLVDGRPPSSGNTSSLPWVLVA